MGRLQASGLKLTKPRLAVLEAISRASGPFTTEEIFHAAQKHLAGAKCDLVTVYRSLAAFADLGLLNRIDFGDGLVRYEWSDPSGHHHHHFVCQGCGRVEPLVHCEIKTQERALSEAGYTGLSHRLEFFGRCPACS